jgi:hypothetical protein
MSPKPLDSDFGIEIDFQPGTDAPSRVFKTITALIEAFQIVDHQLAESVARIEPVLLLENIETGSIIVWLRNKLELLDDDALKSGDWKKVVGTYLVRAKYVMIDFINKRSTISSKVEVEELQAELLEAAKETNVLMIPVYHPLPLPQVLDCVKLLGEATHELRPEDTAKYLSDSGNAQFNASFSISPETLQQLVTREVIVTRIPMILKVKKPDFLGESMWEFRHENRTIEAKVLDEVWLEKFRHRSIVLKPGDAIKAVVESEVNYSFEGDVVSASHKIIKVEELISFERGIQNTLFP